MTAPLTAPARPDGVPMVSPGTNFPAVITGRGGFLGRVIHAEMIQGSDEWKAARCGTLTASEMCRILTPTLKPASNDKERAHLNELLAQRITQYVEPSYVSDAMLRGETDESEARHLYSKAYAPVTQCGFMTSDEWGFTIGYSPDGLVGDDGLIEVKSRAQRFQVATIVEREVPQEYLLQIQTGLLVSGRRWCDFISYSGGLPMVTIRVRPDPEMQAAILSAAEAFEARLAAKLALYRAALTSTDRLIPTERKIEEDMF